MMPFDTQSQLLERDSQEEVISEDHDDGSAIGKVELEKVQYFTISIQVELQRM